MPAGLNREPSKMVVAPIPSDAERNVFDLLLLEQVVVACAPCGSFATEVHLELVRGLYSASRPDCPPVRGSCGCSALCDVLRKRKRWEVRAQ